MPPTCTPEKKNDYQDENLQLDEDKLYLTRSDLENNDEHEEKQRIKELTDKFPEVNKLFFLHKQVGSGTFSTVYLATLKSDESLKKRYAIKHIVPTCHPDRIKFELQCLKNIGGVNNVVGVDLCFRNRNSVIFIMPYQAHDNFNNYVGRMNAKETASYMKNLLTAIRQVHKFNVIHRDIKPSNFLYDRKNKRYLLVDFGLAHEISKKSDGNRANQKRKRESQSLEIPQAKRPQYVDVSKMDSRKSTSQKENDPEGDKLKSFEKNFPLQGRTSKCFENLKNEMKKNPMPLKISPTLSNGQKSLLHQQCRCYGKPKTCTRCVVKKNLRALRAGTPGFRPPEVLLKSTEQDTGVDIWAAGIIMLSILSNCCNFFSSPDDMTALAEIMMIFGVEEIRKVASQCGRHIICSEKSNRLDLRKICCILRCRENVSELPQTKLKCQNCNQLNHFCVCLGTPLNPNIPDNFPEAAYDLLNQLLDVNPRTRISAEDALKHAFVKDV